MEIKFDSSCSGSESIVKETIEKLLTYIETSSSKRKDGIVKKLKNNDKEMLLLLNKLIDRKAILTKSEKCSGRSRILLYPAKRTFIYYAISKQINVPSIDELKEWFSCWYNDSDKNTKGKINDYLYLKNDSLDLSFEKYIELPLSAFTLVTDYCLASYKEIQKQKNRTPVVNPYVSIHKNIILNEEEANAFYEENKNKTKEIKTTENKDTKEKQKALGDKEFLDEYIEDCLTLNKNEKDFVEKQNIVVIKKHLNEIQTEISDIIKNIDIKLKSMNVRNRCFNVIEENNRTVNVLIAKFLMDVDNLKSTLEYLKNIDSIYKAVKLMKDNTNIPLTKEDEQYITELSSLE